MSQRFIGLPLSFSRLKKPLNAINWTMMIKLEDSAIKRNVAAPGFNFANPNGYEGAESVEEGGGGGAARIRGARRRFHVAGG